VKIDEMDMEAEADRILELYGGISTNSPVSSESIPETLHSEN
jgi:hypothetical protein